jgi:hypothetical protein
VSTVFSGTCSPPGVRNSTAAHGTACS